MTAVANTAPPGRRATSPWRVAVVLALLLLLFGFVSLVWTPYPVSSLDVGSAMQDPSGAHWLGTDQLGRDVLSLVMKGLLTSFVVAAVAVAVGARLSVHVLVIVGHRVERHEWFTRPFGPRPQVAVEHLPPCGSMHDGGFGQHSVEIEQARRDSIRQSQPLSSHVPDGICLALGRHDPRG